MRSLPALLPLALLLLAPSAPAATPPWSDPVEVAREHVSEPAVRFTRLGGAIFWQRAPRLGAAPTEVDAYPLDGSALPGQARRVSPVAGPVAAGGRFTVGACTRSGTLVAGSAQVGGERFALRSVGKAPGEAGCSVVVSGAAVAFAIRPVRSGRGYVALSRPRNGRFRDVQRISPRGAIGNVALAANRRGDVLVAWARGRAIEARIVTSRGAHSPVRRIARTGGTPKLDAALAGDGRAVLGWVEQTVDEGTALGNAVFRAAIRPAGRRFAAPRLLERYPDRVIAGGRGVQVAIAGRRIVAAWTGRHAIRAAVAAGTGFGGAHDLGLLGERVYERGAGIADLAAGPAGEVLAVWVQHNESEVYLLTAPLLRGEVEFGSPEVLSEATAYISRASAALDPVTGDAVVAWLASENAFERILAAARPSY